MLCVGRITTLLFHRLGEIHDEGEGDQRVGEGGCGEREARADAIIRGRPYRGKDELPRKNIIPQGVYDNIQARIIARQR